MDETREIELLSDLANLLKKHGRETFESLAAMLAEPDFAHQLSDVLAAIAAAAPPGRTGTQVRRKEVPDRLGRVATRLAKIGGETEAALRPFVEAMQSGAALPAMKDIKGFAQRNNLPTPASKSRRDALASLVTSLINLPLQDLRELIPELEISLGASERSLEGWSRIIERSRAELNG